jgi:hypothetical protein
MRKDLRDGAATLGPGAVRFIVDCHYMNQGPRVRAERFNIGDILVEKEWSNRAYTGRELRRRITYVERAPHHGIREGFVILSLGGEERS